DEREQVVYRAEQARNATISKPGKIDPMGMMGNIFARVGAMLIVAGLLLASLLGLMVPGGFDFSFPVSAGAWGTGLVFLLLGLAQLLLFRNVESARVVDHYFTAFVNQDYVTAFQYLDPAIRTRPGEPATQIWFTRRAQAYDDERGKMTNYVLRGFHLKPKTTYTVKVIRGKRSYLIHLSLSKKDNTWNIAGFDLF
ncbi:MAG: hypothetical protein J2P36_15230, partial [Ktedonobacteraceae bacterium]|nr:hypothetical protein [Ktedonobacteraceae bacterium]